MVSEEEVATVTGRLLFRIMHRVSIVALSRKYNSVPRRTEVSLERYKLAGNTKSRSANQSMHMISRGTPRLLWLMFHQEIVSLLLSSSSLQ